MKIILKLKSYFPQLGLLAICFLAYGILSPRLGFYLDDWYIVWFHKVLGASKFQEFFRSDRPLFAYVYMIFLPIFKDSRISWQLFALFTRWLAVCTFWYLIKQIIPNRNHLTLTAAILMAVYPGFQFHWFSVMYSQVYILFAIYFLSYIFMIWSEKKRRHKGAFLVAALILQFIGIAPMEYFYGLELGRPIVLFFIINSEGDSLWKRIKQALVKWIPYLILFIGFTIFRIGFSQEYSYPIKFLADLKTSPFDALLTLFGNIFRCLFNSTIQVWFNLLQIFKRDLLTASSIFMIGLVAVGFTIAFLILIQNEKSNGANSIHVERNMIWLGIFLALIAMIPFLMAGFEVDLEFPNNRFLLALTPGISLFTSGTVFYIIRTNRQKTIIAALLASLSIGSQFLVARSFMLHWDQQKDFLAQLTWRIPGVKENTIFVTEDLSFSQYFSGASLTAPLNLIYAPQNTSHQIPYLMHFFPDGQLSQTSTLEEYVSIEHSFRGFQFKGNGSDILTFVKPRDGCLRVLTTDNPVEEFKYSKRYEYWADAIHLSNMDTIIPDPETPAILPANIFGDVSTDQWCYYFEKADLARQLSRWDEVISLYNQAEAFGFKPNIDVEWIPLIEAYFNTGQQEKAKNLTRQLSLDGLLTREVICYSWLNLKDQETQPAEAENIEQLLIEFNCQVRK